MISLALLNGLPPLDLAAECGRIEAFLTRAVTRLKRRGVVLGVSGGIDSAVCAALAVRALGPGRVFALLMPERETNDDSEARATRLCRRLGIGFAVEDVTAGLEAIGCYRRRDEALHRLCPEYGPGWRHKIAISGTGIPYFNLVLESPGGERSARRLPADVYLQVVAATNYKQRVRKAVEYFHAERLNHAVLGTPNRLEYDLGFFVRGGDGLADVKPIAHLYKTQVYALAEHLDVPEEIRAQPPSTNTYSLPQTQEEFYFALPYDQADLLLHAMATGVAEEEAAAMLGVDPDRLRRLWRDFAGKRRLAERTLGEALLVEEA
jgi:NAD+ synthase